MAEQVVIQEFLARLGFRVDAPSLRAFATQLKNNCMTAGKLAASLVGVAVAAEAVAVIFAKNMQKLYYASQTTGASAENIQAFAYGLKQIGLEAGDARQLLEGLGNTLRERPYTRGMLQSLGVDASKDRDNLEVLLDLIDKLKERYPGEMGYPLATGFFKQITGGTEPQFNLLSKQTGELRRYIAERKAMQATAGVDPKAAAEAGKEFMREANALWEKLGLLGDKFRIELLEPFKEMNKELGETITKFTEWLSSEEGRSSISSFAIHTQVAAQAAADSLRALNAARQGKWSEANKYDAQAFEKIKYLLDPFGVAEPPPEIKALIEKAAKGKGNLSFTTPSKSSDFPGQYAFGKDISGQHLDAWRMLTDGLRQRGNDPYNAFRIGNEMDYVLGEIQRGGDMTIHQTTHITVPGAADPVTTAREVGRRQRSNLESVIRNNQAVTQ